MNIVKAVLPVEQRRMKIGLATLGFNMILFALALFLKPDVDFTDLGGGLALIDVPILAFIIGESIRPTISNIPIQTNIINE
jgi:hypothetical protein